MHWPIILSTICLLIFIGIVWMGYIKLDENWFGLGILGGILTIVLGFGALCLFHSVETITELVIPDSILSNEDYLVVVYEGKVFLSDKAEYVRRSEKEEVVLEKIMRKNTYGGFAVPLVYKIVFKEGDL